MTPECKFCGTHEDVVYTEITGFDQPRSGGGTNHIILREPTGKFACRRCIGEKSTRKTEGVMEGQEALL